MLTANPDDTYSLVLERDKDKPEGKQRKITFRHLSAREWKPVQAFNNDLENKKSDDQVADSLDEIIEHLGRSAVNWENISNGDGEPKPFDLKEFDAVLTPADIVVLFVKMVRANGLDPGTIKKFNAPSVSEREPSVEDAPAVQTSAPTGPASTSPSSPSAQPATEKDAGSATSEAVTK